MALQGNYIHYTYEDHPTETTEHTITYPADLSEDHPDYDKRGTEETIQVPVQVESSTTYENCYIMVRAASIYTLVLLEGIKEMELSYFWRLYESEEARNNDPENYILEDQKTHNYSFDEGTNPYDLAYSYIQSSKGGEALTSI